MDYLDPKKKKAHKTRLLVGYVLFAVIISMMTVLFLYVANGYFIDRKTGEIIQNGLVFIDTQPVAANISLNGMLQRGGTDARLVIPAGKYTIDLSADGYRSWSRTIDLEGGSLRRLTYARLIPTELVSEVAVSLPADPAYVSQSVDKRWMIISYPNNATRLTLIDLNQNVPTAQDLNLDESIVDAVADGTYEVEEWADDNTHALLRYGAVTGAQQYILLNRSDAAATQNLSRLFAVSELEISMQDRKRDRFFVFNPASEMLYSASLNDGISSTPFIDKPLLDIETFGTDWAVYVIANEDASLVDVRLRRGNQDILLKTIKKDSEYFIELAKLGNVPVIAVASPKENPISVFYDPEKYLAENNTAKSAVAATIIRVKDLQDLSISSDSSTLLAYGSDRVVSYEFEGERSYSFSIGIPIDNNQTARWMDGQHFSFSSNGVQHMVDFDGSNSYDLVESIPTLGSFYNQNIETMITFSSSVPASEDRPATPAKLLTTSLVVAN